MESQEIWLTILLPILLGQFFIYIKTVYDNYLNNKKQQRKILFDEKLKNLKNILQDFYWPVYIKLLCIYQLNYNIPIKNQYEYISSSEEDDDYEINIPSKKCNNIYLKSGNFVHCKSKVPLTSNIICKKCRWRTNNNDSNSDSSSSSLSEENDTIEITIPFNDVSIDIENPSITENTILDDYKLKTIVIDKKTVEIMEENLNKIYNEVQSILENNMHNLVYCEKINKTFILFIKYCKIRNIINVGSINQKYNPNYFGVINNTNTLLTLIEKMVIKYQKEYNDLLLKGPFK